MQHLRDNNGVLEASNNGTDWEPVVLGEGGGGGIPSQVEDPVQIGGGRIRWGENDELEFSNDGGTSWFPPLYESYRVPTLAETALLGDGVVQISGAGFVFGVSQDGGSSFRPVAYQEQLNELTISNTGYIDTSAAEFYPPLIESDTEPNRDGLIIWHDTTVSAEKWHLIYREGTTNHKVELS